MMSISVSVGSDKKDYMIFVPSNENTYPHHFSFEDEQPINKNTFVVFCVG
jgi:hypothetical protein